MRKYYKAHGLKYEPVGKLTKEEIADDILKVYKKTSSSKRKYYEVYGKYSWCAIKDAFGGWNRALNYLDLPINAYNVSKEVTKEDIADEMKRLYEKYGYLTARLQRKKSKYSQNIIDTFYGSFNNMLKELGYDTNLDRDVSDDDILYNIKLIYYNYGYLSQPIINDNCIVTFTTVHNRFGSLSKVCKILHIDNNHSQRDSYGSLKVEEYLMNHNIKYEKEKTFEWLRRKESYHHLHLDFYLQDYSLGIEYDGSQHYKSIEHFGGEEGLIKIQARDQEKEKLCCEHGVKIFRIRYDENIENKLNNLFSKQ